MNSSTSTLNVAIITKRVEWLNRVIESQSLALRSAWAQRNWAMAAFQSARAVLKASGINFQYEQYGPSPALDLLDMATEFQLTPDIQIMKLSFGWVIVSSSRGGYLLNGWEHEGIENWMVFDSPFAALAYFQANPRIFLHDSSNQLLTSTIDEHRSVIARATPVSRQ